MTQFFAVMVFATFMVFGGSACFSPVDVPLGTFDAGNAQGGGSMGGGPSGGGNGGGAVAGGGGGALSQPDAGCTTNAQCGTTRVCSEGNCWCSNDCGGLMCVDDPSCSQCAGVGAPPGACCPGLQLGENGGGCESAACRPLDDSCDGGVACCEGLTCTMGRCVRTGVCNPAGAACELTDPNGCCGDSFCTIDWLARNRCYRKVASGSPCKGTGGFACHSDEQCCNSRCISTNTGRRCER